MIGSEELTDAFAADFPLQNGLAATTRVVQSPMLVFAWAVIFVDRGICIIRMRPFSTCSMKGQCVAL